MRRRVVIGAASVYAGSTALWRRISGIARADAVNLLTAPLELTGDWGGSPVPSARLVIERARTACLGGITLYSDRQPHRLQVEAHTSGLPHIQLDAVHRDTAEIVVDAGTRRWAQLAYQFGHELGHVTCNSWVWQTKLEPPSHWLEEVLVEAFSLRGLAGLGDSWERDPPFPGNSAFGQAIRDYRQTMVAKYRGETQSPDGITAWYRTTRARLDALPGLNPFAGPAVVAILAEYERDKGCVEDLGAINRWPQRSALPTEDYLTHWQESCAQIKAPGRMPRRLRGMFGLA